MRSYLYRHSRCPPHSGRRGGPGRKQGHLSGWVTQGPEVAAFEAEFAAYGGMLTTNNPDYDRKFALLRQHGMSVPDLARLNSDKIIFESYPEVGYNYRMTDIQAAVGRVQLKRLPEIVRRRRELAAHYLDAFDDITGLTLKRRVAHHFGFIGKRSRGNGRGRGLGQDRRQRPLKAGLGDGAVSETAGAAPIVFLSAR